MTAMFQFSRTVRGAGTTPLRGASRRALARSCALIVIIALVFQTMAPSRAQANPLAGGLIGAIFGTAIGGIVGGKRGARAGAAIGGLTGALAGTGEAKPPPSAPIIIYPPDAMRPSQLVMNIQRSLVRLGYNPGPVDGRFGAATAAAIRTYQARNGLPVTGHPSVALARHMLRNGGAPTGPQVGSSGLFRVVGVSADDVLNVRGAPSGNAPIVGALSPFSSGIRRYECIVPASSGTEWCRIRRQGLQGWVASRFLAPQLVAVAQ